MFIACYMLAIYVTQIVWWRSLNELCQTNIINYVSKFHVPLKIISQYCVTQKKILTNLR